MAALDVPNEENFAHYADVIEKDPNLKDVTSLEELHTKLAELSQTCLNENSSVFSQLTFDGVNPNPAFQPNLFKKDIGCDGRKITSYYRYAIKNEEHVVAALEYACDSTPSLLIPASSDGNIGALYQGGFKAVGNLKFLQEHKVTYIVNTARDLGAFFPKFNKYVSSARGIGVEFLELDWVDDREQVRMKIGLGLFLRRVQHYRCVHRSFRRKIYSVRSCSSTKLEYKVILCLCTVLRFVV